MIKRVLLWRAICVVFVGTGLLFAQESEPQRPSVLRISKVSAVPKELERLGQDQVAISFSTNFAGSGTVNILDQWHRHVRALEVKDATPGDHTITWDGQDGNGKLCRGTWFSYTLDMKGPAGQPVVYDPAGQRVGREVLPQKFTFNAASGQLAYVLPCPAMVRIRIGLKDGPLMRTLTDWEPQLAGAHKLVWDGMDASGLVSLREHPAIDVSLSAFALPPNSILVKQDASDLQLENLNELAVLGKRREKSADTYHQWSVDPSHLHEPGFSATFPSASQSDDGQARVVGRTPIRIKINPEDVQHLTNTQFEVMVYVDGVFVFEEESGTSPLTFYWDTDGLSPGKHFVTVNVLSYDGQIGTTTVPVLVGDEQ